MIALKTLLLKLALVSLRANGTLPTRIPLSPRTGLLAQDILFRSAVPTIGGHGTTDSRTSRRLYRSIHRGSTLLLEVLLPKCVHTAPCRGEADFERRHGLAFIEQEAEEGCTRGHTRNHNRCIEFYYAITVLDDNFEHPDSAP